MSTTLTPGHGPAAHPAHHAKADAAAEEQYKDAPPLTEPVGPLPRLCKPTDRAPFGCTRFKCSCKDYGNAGPFPSLYVLVKSDPPVKPDDKAHPAHPAKADAKVKADDVHTAESDARAFYLECVGLTHTLDRMKKNRLATGGTEAVLDPPDVSVVAFPD